KVALNGGEIRADSPWKHGQQKKGSLILTVRYDASFESGFAGGFAFTAENVALKLPDGTTVGVIQDGESQSTELIGPNSTKKDLFSRFEIDDPAPGAYVLLVRSFDNAEDEIPFTIGRSLAGGSTPAPRSSTAVRPRPGSPTCRGAGFVIPQRDPVRSAGRGVA
ncbi:MAG TPA: hypothetical protein VFR93_10050, partial [Candidatus Limnocylindrales bacterium]|nr:hypothetical protein [Candidatus Limnocylindrales bacterium]